MENFRYNFEKISNKLTDFEEKLLRLEQIRYIENPNQFYKEAAYLKKVDGKVSYYYLYSQIKSNKFNEGSGYLTHGFDFYHGSFHGQMIRGLINFCNLNQKSIILDPFCGSGTTLVEAKLLGFDSIGIDISPIACLNSKIKTELLNYPVKNISIENLNLNYVPIKNSSFRELLSNDIQKTLSLFLYMRALSMESRFSLNRQIGIKKTYNKIVDSLSKFEILKKKIDIKWGSSKIIFGDNMEHLKFFNSNSIDAVITSPPYFDLIDYIEEDIVQLRQIFNKKEILDLKHKSIGNKLHTSQLTDKLYWEKIDKLLNELYRVLKFNKHLILIIGNYRNMMESYLNKCKSIGFEIERVLRREIVNIKKKQNLEYVIFLNKPK